jgi:hypothetical protein
MSSFKLGALPFNDDLEWKESDWKNMARVGGMATHLPGQALINTWMYLDPMDSYPEREDWFRNLLFRSPSEFK